MTEAYAVGKSVNPKILLLQVLGKAQCCKGVINTLSEIEILLRLRV